MKSTETYRVIREILSPWCRSHGFKRTKSGMAGWHRPIDNTFLSFWFQCSMDGWDDFVGSKFIIEFQLSDKPVIGTGQVRVRLPQVLDVTQLEQVRKIQNDIISGLRPPSGDYYVLHISPEVREWYLDKFKLITLPYTNTSDIWLRYKSEMDVRRWAEFLLIHLPSILSRFAPNWDS